MKTKKAISPVIATTLLIAIVVAMSVIIFIWARGMVEEKVTKFGNENIELACNKVVFEAAYEQGNLNIVNTGNVPIYDMQIKEITSEGSYTARTLRESSVLNLEGINKGEGYSQAYTTEAKTIALTPILIGTSDKGRRTHLCEEYHGIEISI